MGLAETCSLMWSWTKVVFAVLLGVYALLLVFLNFDGVTVRYVFGEIELPKALVIVLSALVGAGIYALRSAVMSMVRNVREQIAARRAARAAAVPPAPGATPVPVNSGVNPLPASAPSGASATSPAPGATAPAAATTTQSGG